MQPKIKKAEELIIETKIASNNQTTEPSQRATNIAPLTQFKSSTFSPNKALLINNPVRLNSKQKNRGFDFFDSVIGFLYLVMFVIFTAMYFILLIATYASMPLVIAFGLAMLLSLLTCLTGQFIQV